MFMLVEQQYKRCGVCGATWSTREQFLDDSDVTIIGYQANFVDLEKGLFLFNHSCEGTLSVKVSDFSDLYSGPMFQEMKKGSEECSGYCLHRNNLRACPVKCECVYVRNILQRFQRTAEEGS